MWSSYLIWLTRKYFLPQICFFSSLNSILVNGSIIYFCLPDTDELYLISVFFSLTSNPSANPESSTTNIILASSISLHLHCSIHAQASITSWLVYCNSVLTVLSVSTLDLCSPSTQQLKNSFKNKLDCVIPYSQTSCHSLALIKCLLNQILIPHPSPRPYSQDFFL